MADTAARSFVVSSCKAGCGCYNDGGIYTVLSGGSRLYLVITRHNACAGLFKNREKKQFSFFQLKNFKTTKIKLMPNPTGVQS